MHKQQNAIYNVLWPVFPWNRTWTWPNVWREKVRSCIIYIEISQFWQANCLQGKEDIPNTSPNPGQCPQTGQQYVMKNKAAIALQCKSNSKLNSCLALYFVYSSYLRRLPICLQGKEDTPNTSPNHGQCPQTIQHKE